MLYWTNEVPHYKNMKNFIAGKKIVRVSQVRLPPPQNSDAAFTRVKILWLSVFLSLKNIEFLLFIPSAANVASTMIV